jgi:uncharacterized membrane protein YedE/YeeE
MKFIIYPISLLLATLLGFAVHRASLCTVKTVAEIFSTRKIYMLMAMLKTVLWVMTISMPIILFLPDVAAPNRSYAITIAAIIGGFTFGVGAAINGGCAFSTLGHLANGNIWMLTTILGYCLGVAGLSIMVPMTEPGQALIPLLFKAQRPFIFAILAALWLFLSWEIFRLWKTRKMGHSLSQLFLSKYYRLSTAAIVLGFSGGVLYALYDTWTYTNALKQKVQSIWMPVEKPASINLLLFIALFCGMVLSALQRRSWRLQWRPIQTWPRHLIGGVLMGTGAVLIPGGNDTLMLKSLPGLSPHALPAMAALFFGIGVTLPLLRLLTGKSVKVVCTNDTCQSQN